MQNDVDLLYLSHRKEINLNALKEIMMIKTTTSSHPYLSDGTRILWDSCAHGYIVYCANEKGAMIDRSFKHWDDAYSALVKHKTLLKLLSLKDKKISRTNKTKLYCVYSLILLRNSFF